MTICIGAAGRVGVDGALLSGVVEAGVGEVWVPDVSG